MGFWGIEVKPGKPYPFYSEDALGILHITQATLGRGSSIEKSIVQCSVGDESPIFLCSLLPDKIESIPLNLEFDEDNSVAFSVIGPRSVHLSGFFKVVDSKDSFGVDHDSDSHGEDIAETDTDESGSTDFDTEEEYEDDFIDDGDLKMFSTSPVLNRGVIIEEIFDDNKSANGNSRSKRLKKKSQVSESDDNDTYEKQIVVKSGSGDPVLESEDEDGFPIPTPLQGKPNVQKPEVDAEAEEEMDQKNAKKTKKKRPRDGISHEGSSKRKVNGNMQDGQPESEAPQPISSSHLSTEAVPENNVKQKNKKKQKTQSKGGKAQEKSTGLESNDLPIGNEEDEKLTNEKSMEIDTDSVPNQTEEKKKRKKKKKKGKTLENGGDANTDETVKAAALEKEEAKASQVRTFPNGLVIEEIAMGTPDGKRASPGKKVSVVYIGKLQKNGKIFDSNVGGPPFKFRLGIGQVIKGWDVGVNGMRIGDKRRLTIPPSMGYGAKGAGNAIPPNAWLLFDVELIDVR